MRTRMIVVDDLAFFSDPDQDSDEFVMTHFKTIAEFVGKYRLDRNVSPSQTL